VDPETLTTADKVALQILEAIDFWPLLRALVVSMAPTVLGLYRRGAVYATLTFLTIPLCWLTFGEWFGFTLAMGLIVLAILKPQSEDNPVESVEVVEAKDRRRSRVLRAEEEFRRRQEGNWRSSGSDLAPLPEPSEPEV
jgi:hypothetical protein